MKVSLFPYEGNTLSCFGVLYSTSTCLNFCPLDSTSLPTSVLASATDGGPMCTCITCFDFSPTTIACGTSAFGYQVIVLLVHCPENDNCIYMYMYILKVDNGCAVIYVGVNNVCYLAVIDFLCRFSYMISIHLPSRAPCEVTPNRSPALMWQHHLLTWLLVGQQTRKWGSMIVVIPNLWLYSVVMAVQCALCRWIYGRLSVDGTYGMRSINFYKVLNNICWYLLQLWWDGDSMGPEDGKRAMAKSWTVSLSLVCLFKVVYQYRQQLVDVFHMLCTIKSG